MRDGSINLDGFHKAASRINSHVRNTPLLDSKPLKNDLIPSGSLFLKLENLQPTGSFKVRGAINTLKTLSEVEKNKGLITASGFPLLSIYQALQAKKKNRNLSPGVQQLEL